MAKKAKSKKRRKKRSRRTEAIDSVVGTRQKKINGIDLYQVENALDTMTRAEEMQKDEKLMKATEKLLKRRRDALSKVDRSLKNRS